VDDRLGKEPVHAAVTQSFILPSRNFRPVKPGPMRIVLGRKKLTISINCVLLKNEPDSSRVQNINNLP